MAIVIFSVFTSLSGRLLKEASKMINGGAVRKGQEREEGATPESDQGTRLSMSSGGRTRYSGHNDQEN